MSGVIQILLVWLEPVRLKVSFKRFRKLTPKNAWVLQNCFESDITRRTCPKWLNYWLIYWQSDHRIIGGVIADSLKDWLAEWLTCYVTKEAPGKRCKRDLNAMRMVHDRHVMLLLITRVNILVHMLALYAKTRLHSFPYWQLNWLLAIWLINHLLGLSNTSI